MNLFASYNEFSIILFGIMFVVLLFIFVNIFFYFKKKSVNYNEILQKKKSAEDELIHINKILEEKNENLKKKNEEFNELSHNNEKKISEYNDKLKNMEHEFDEINARTKELQEMAQRANEINEKLILWENVKDKISQDNETLSILKSKLDLYSRIDEFTEHGLFEKPEYIFKTSERYAVQIEEIRNQQKEMIKNNQAITGPSNPFYISELKFVGKIIDNQKKLIIKTFNIECDYLISKVNSANLKRTLERIENIANSLEKQMADLRFGINNNYIQLKMEECKLQYQNELLKKQEADEQREIRERIREEQKARREYERALEAAEKDERIYSEMLERAKSEAASATGDALQAANFKILQLEKQLAEALSRAERAKSMAEQTKYGYVYIISNIGSFGENIYKIGLTRRLDPTERVRELGDASVPFSFDIHAMISSDNAPALEHALHMAFEDRRVNAVNIRKEFFRVSLDEIRAKVEELTNSQASFITTIKADEYFQTKRLLGNNQDNERMLAGNDEILKV